MSRSRRNFIKKSSAASAAIVLGGVLPGFSASQYRRIIGSNEKITAAVMGVNSRGFSVGSNFASQKECEMMYVCDVDVRAMDKCVAAIEKLQGKKPKAE
ncbi:MAG: twin-arginine translocation signal domain-containing protein, partial [Chitinophagaceae bacterium]